MCESRREYKSTTSCRSCGYGRLREVINLGDQYVSDFLDPDCEDLGNVVPIVLDRCPECTLVQARNAAPQELLYSRKYWYKSGVTDTMRAALQDVADCILGNHLIKPSDVVLDIGSNDGTFLRCLPDWAIRIGVEPAENFVEEGSRGIDNLIPEFWSREAYGDRPAPKVITALGMFYDLEDPNQFVQDVEATLADDGFFVSQLMCLHDTIQNLDVGNFAHEHLEFYTLRSLCELFTRNGLTVYRVEHNAVNGGSYRVFAAKADHAWRMIDSTVHKTLAREAYLLRDETYDDFTRAIERNRDVVYHFVEKNRRNNDDEFWVYGASTKGNVILQYMGLDYTLVDAAAERSPEKYGKVTVGTRIPIKSEEDARMADPHYMIVLPYAFIDEFLVRERKYLDQGGRFLVPVPHLTIY